MSKPSVIEKGGVRHTGTGNCPVLRKRGYCSYCVRVVSRMPEPSQSTGSPQRVDIPFRTDGNRILTFASCRSDLIRLSWEVERFTPRTTGLAFKPVLQDPSIRHAASAASVSVPSLDAVQQRMTQLRQSVRQKLLDMAGYRACENKLRGDDPGAPNESFGVLSSLGPVS